MKNKTLFTCLALFCSIGAARAQKLQKPYIDKITGDTTQSTSEERIYTKVGLASSQLLYTSVKKTKGLYYMILKMDNVNGYSVYSVSPTQETIFKFTDGSTYNIKPGIESTSSDRVIDAGRRSILSAYYSLREGDIKILTEKQISIIRIKTTSGDIDYEISDKNGSLLKKEIELLQKKAV